MTAAGPVLALDANPLSDDELRRIDAYWRAAHYLSVGPTHLRAHPLPFIVALVIAGVDVLETSFLLLVVTLRR